MLGNNRSVHLLDIENLLGTGMLEPKAINARLVEYKTHVAMGRTDQVIVGVSSDEGLLALHSSDLRNCRLLHRRGKDGADLVLQEVLEGEELDLRFTTVYLGTGDGGFSESVAALASRGAHVVVISLAESLSKRLRLAAHRTIELHADTTERDAA